MEPLKGYKNIRRTYTHGVPTFYSNFHLGVDLIVPAGTLIYAPFDGYAKKDDDDPNDDLGNCVYFQFGDLIMRCAHLSRWGALGNVKQGDVIGYSGNTGLSTAPHVHLDLSKAPFNVNDRGRFIDPDKFDWKGDDMTNEQAKLLIYKATQGHEPQGNERNFALGPISPDELAGLRFRDDVIGSAWIASNGDYCPDSEKQFWANSQRENGGHPVETFARQWFKDHVQPKLDNLDERLEAQMMENARLDALYGEKNAAYDQLASEAAKTFLELKSAETRVSKLEQDLQTCRAAAPQTMSAFDMIIEGIRKLLRIS